MQRAGPHVLLALLLVAIVAPYESAARAALPRPPASAAAAPAPPRAVPPKVAVGNLSIGLTRSYTWSLQRTSSASVLAVLADAKQRQQMGYTLTASKQLSRLEYTVAGEVALTNPSGSAWLDVSKVELYVGIEPRDLSCGSLPASALRLAPAEVFACAFSLSFAADPGATSLRAFASSSAGRSVGQAPAQLSFEACSSAAGGARCSISSKGDCVSVTDGSYLQQTYKDEVAAAASGNVSLSRSELFAVPNVGNANLAPSAGPPRVEAVRLPPAPLPAEPAPEWWQIDRGPSGLARRRQRRLARRLAQADAALAQFSKFASWPYPQITGDRPPRPAQDAHQQPLPGTPADPRAERRICDSRAFHYGMVFGPLLPVACGNYQVLSTAAAAYTDSQAPPVVLETQALMQVLCPAPQAPGAGSGAAQPGEQQPQPAMQMPRIARSSVYAAAT